MNQAKAFLQSHEHTDKDDFRTPPYLVKYIESTFGSITHDGACSEENKLAVPFNLFGLDELPDNSMLYINPPFSTPLVKEFVSAAVRKLNNSQGSTCVFLLPNKLSEDMFAVYTKFENEGKNNNGEYSLIIGAAVETDANVPEGYTSTIIPSSTYQIFESEAGNPEKIGEKWQKRPI